MRHFSIVCISFFIVSINTYSVGMTQEEFDIQKKEAEQLINTDPLAQEAHIRAIISNLGSFIPHIQTRDPKWRRNARQNLIDLTTTLNTRITQARTGTPSLPAAAVKAAELSVLEEHQKQDTVHRLFDYLIKTKQDKVATATLIRLIQGYNTGDAISTTQLEKIVATVHHDKNYEQAYAMVQALQTKGDYWYTWAWLPGWESRITTDQKILARPFVPTSQPASIPSTPTPIVSVMPVSVAPPIATPTAPTRAPTPPTPSISYLPEEPTPQALQARYSPEAVKKRYSEEIKTLERTINNSDDPNILASALAELDGIKRNHEYVKVIDAATLSTDYKRLSNAAYDKLREPTVLPPAPTPIVPVPHGKEVLTIEEESHKTAIEEDINRAFTYVDLENAHQAIIKEFKGTHPHTFQELMQKIEERETYLQKEGILSKPGRTRIIEAEHV